MVQYQRRQPARRLSYFRRYEALCTNDQLRIDMIRKLLFVLLVAIDRNKDNPEFSSLLRTRFQGVARLYFLHVYEPMGQIARLSPRLGLGIEDFNEGNCRINFLFGKIQLRELIRLLQFPELVTLANRITLTGEEVFLRFLYEFVSGDNQHRIGANVFGAGQPLQSRAFTWVVDYIHSEWSFLIMNNLDWWFRNGFCAKSAAAIGRKIGIADNLVAWFLDCNCLETHVMGGGPVGDGVNAPRWDETIQRSFYNAWKARHGLKHQTLDNAYGITVDIYGPLSLRRNDLALLRQSELRERLAAHQPVNGVQYIAMGDSIYKKSHHITSYHKAIDLIEDYVNWNVLMKQVRISIEWNYGGTAAMFKYLQNKTKLTLLTEARTSKVYIVATLLRNIHCMYYGSQTSNYFGLLMPDNMVQKFINQEDF